MGITRIYGPDWLRFDNTIMGIGIPPTARLTLAAGTAAVHTAPLKLTTGTALGTPEDGAVEYDASHLWFTIGAVRYQLDQQGGGHTQNTDTGTTSLTFNLSRNYSYGDHLLVSSSIDTTDTNWNDVYWVNLSSYWVVSYRFMVAVRDTVTNEGGAFTATGVLKRGNAANTTAYIENPATVIRLGSDYSACAYFQVNVVEDAATAQLRIQVKAINVNLTRWTCIGEMLVII